MKFKDLESSHFPTVEPNRFEEWKQAGILFNKQYPFYVFGIFGVLFLIVFFTTGNILMGGVIPMLIAVYGARSIAGGKYLKITQELGISLKDINKLLKGKIEYVETTLPDNKHN